MIELFFGALPVTFLILGISLISLIYWYSVRNHDYWKKRGIPTAKTIPFFGSILEAFSKPLHDIEMERYRQFGRMYGHFEGNNAVLSLAEPTLLKEILVKDFPYFQNRRVFNSGDKVVDSMLTIIQGEDWKRVRNIVTPTFSTGKIKRMLGIFKDCSKSLIENFKREAETRKSVDAKRLYGAFTMDIIASSAFSTKIDSHNDPDNKFVQTARNVFTRNINWRFLFFFAAPGLMKFCGVSIFGGDTMKFFKDVTYEIMEERKRTGQVRNDFLQLLMDTAKEVSKEQTWDIPDKESGDIASNYGEEDVGYQIFKNVTSKHLSMDELVAQCVIFFLAGFDTTSSTLSFATYLLALNPDAQSKLRKEVNEAVNNSKGEMTYETIQSMKYLDNVISETLRLYPPAVRMERVANSDYKLGDTGLTIPKGMIVTIPVFAMHRDAKLYPHPDKFNPDRFTMEERAKRNPYAYLPFGAGPRNCVGMRFALLEIKVCLAYVIATFNVKKCPKTKVPLDFYMSQGLIQPKEIYLEMEIRSDGPLEK